MASLLSKSISKPVLDDIQMETYDDSHVRYTLYNTVKTKAGHASVFYFLF